MSQAKRPPRTVLSLLRESFAWLLCITLALPWMIDRGYDYIMHRPNGPLYPADQIVGQLLDGTLSSGSIFFSGKYTKRNWDGAWWRRDGSPAFYCYVAATESDMAILFCRVGPDSQCHLIAAMSASDYRSPNPEGMRWHFVEDDTFMQMIDYMMAQAPNQ